MVILPAASQRVSLQHFKQQMSAAARGVHFFTRHHVTWAHRAVLFFAAFADSDASRHRERKAVFVVWIFEVSLRFRMIVLRSQTQVVDDAIRRDHLARIHLPIWIPEDLEFTKGLDQFRTEHLGKQFSSRLSIAVFSGK